MALSRQNQFLPDSALAFLSRRTREGAGLLLLALTLGGILALLSYSPGDGSLNSASDAPIQNLLGIPGAYGADFLLQSVGLTAFAPLALFSVWGLRLVAKQDIPHPVLQLVLALIAVFLLAIGLSAVPSPAQWPLRAGTGGVIGTMVLSHAHAAMTPLGMSVFHIATIALLLGLTAFLLALGLRRNEWRAIGRGLLVLGRIGGAVVGRLLARRHGGASVTDRAEPHLGKKKGGAKTPLRRKTGRRAAVKSKPVDQNDVLARTGAGTEDDFVLPPLELLEEPEFSPDDFVLSSEELQQNAERLETVLRDFGVHGEITAVRPGPVIALYELEPAPGTKTSRVVGLADDISRSMKALSVRIAVIPGKSVIGIELPNQRRETVMLREVMGSQMFNKSASKMGLAIALGKDIGGDPLATDLSSMPHLLIAGTTGSGKSVAINTMILSLLYRYGPDQCRLIMIDPKMLELSVYDGIPHLLAPVVTDPGKAVVALKWAVREMEDRYRAMSALKVRDIRGYNERLAMAAKTGEALTRRVQTGFDAQSGKPIFEEQVLDDEPLPMIVVVVDEMADLMMVAGKDIEAAVQRLSQMARAAGIHLILATQRPSVDVITGTIKANFSSRISFQVTSKIDSRTILDEQGAEQLLGRGDMLYTAGGGRISRVHGPFVSDREVERVTAFLKEQGAPVYVDAVTRDEEELALHGEAASARPEDPLYDEAVAVVARAGKASTSFIQRHLRIGYNRAACIIERMEEEGVVGKANRSGKREVLVGDHTDLES